MVREHDKHLSLPESLRKGFVDEQVVGRCYGTSE